MADVEYALEFRRERLFVVKRGVAPVEGMTRRRPEAALADGIEARGAIQGCIDCVFAPAFVNRSGHDLILFLLFSVPRKLGPALPAPYTVAGLVLYYRGYRAPSGNGWRARRSASAKVSNQSATSPKPSSRAALAIPGYPISVYSWVPRPRSPLSGWLPSDQSEARWPGRRTCSRYSR